MIEIPEYILWDGNTTNIEKWEHVTYDHFWFSPTRGREQTDHYYMLLDDGRIVRFTHLSASKRDETVPVDVLYLGRGYVHHIKKKTK